ncbi:hypothetical protein SAMN05421761_103305 [Belliella pelovolcani]|uniref:Uncharacterized protein n=1 Tax=Belliella pelovolcani TaxID=529505 RepID=A0A1N7LG37_9BACT|nr:hypothetical protein SAMN05421761_103305 [Belliella pelovolcani]
MDYWQRDASKSRSIAFDFIGEFSLHNMDRGDQLVVECFVDVYWGYFCCRYFSSVWEFSAFNGLGGYQGISKARDHDQAMVSQHAHQQDDGCIYSYLYSFSGIELAKQPSLHRLATSYRCLYTSDYLFPKEVRQATRKSKWCLA